MSDTKSTKVNVITIDPKKTVDVTIGGLFYQRLNKLFIEYGDSVGKNELLEAMMRIKKDIAHKDDFAYNLETLIILLKSVEKSFQDAGFTIDNEIDMDVLPEKPTEK